MLIHARNVYRLWRKTFQLIYVLYIKDRSRDLLPRMNSWASCFKGYWRSLHRLAFPSARRYFALHAQPFDFMDTGIHGDICDPTFFHYVYQLTGTLFFCDIKRFAFIPPINGVGFPAHCDKKTILDISGNIFINAWFIIMGVLWKLKV